MLYRIFARSTAALSQIPRERHVFNPQEQVKIDSQNAIYAPTLIYETRDATLNERQF